MIHPEATDYGYADIFKVPDWFDENEAGDRLLQHDVVVPRYLYRAAGNLAAIHQLGALPDAPRTVFEFGSGRGEGLIALDMMLRDGEGVKVIGSEIEDVLSDVAEAVAEDLPTVQAVERDGLSLLEKSQGKFDIVYANMFGASYEDNPFLGTVNPDLPDRFMPPALESLSEDGVILLASDIQTIDHVLKWTGRNLTPEQVRVVLPPDIPMELEVTPHLVITA